MTSRKNFVTVFKQLSLLDKLLPLLIILAMVVGVLLSVYVPLSRTAFDGAEIVGVAVPLAVGLIVMMVPPLCKVEWENFFVFVKSKYYLTAIITSLVLNWIICPLLMFGLAWASLFDEPEYRTGIIMIGLARCIAMVLLWNDIAGGDNNLCAIIVLVNSLLQVVLYAPYQVLFCYAITGQSPAAHAVSYSLVARSVALFIGVPLGFGLIIRLAGLYTMGKENFNKRAIPFIAPWALIGLLYTILVIFIQRGFDFIKNIGLAIRCFVPLTAYFLIAWFGTFFLVRWMAGFLWSNGRLSRKSEDAYPSEETALLCGCQDKIQVSPKKWRSGCSATYKETITQSFTAASNNFELSLAVAISIYGAGSKQSIAATFGPLLEVPILLILAFAAKFLQNSFVWSDVEEDNDLDFEIACH